MKSSLSLENQMKIPYIGYWNKIIQYIVLFNIHSQYLFDSYLILFTIIVVAVDARCNQSWSIDCNEIKSYAHTFQLHRLSLAVVGCARAYGGVHSVVARTHPGVTSRVHIHSLPACLPLLLYYFRAKALGNYLFAFIYNFLQYTLRLWLSFVVVCITYI